MKDKIHTIMFSLMLLMAGETQATPGDYAQEYEDSLARLTSSLQHTLQSAAHHPSDNTDLARGGILSRMDEVVSDYISGIAHRMNLSEHQSKSFFGMISSVAAIAFKATTGVEISTPIKPSTLIHASCKAALKKFLEKNTNELLSVFMLSYYDNLSATFSQ